MVASTEFRFKYKHGLQIRAIGDLNDDFSNFFKIERDTVYSLKNDGFTRNGIPKDMPINHVAEFGLQYDKPSKQRIRGVLIEYYHNKSEVTNSANFSEIVEKKLFFNVYLFIKNGATPQQL